MQYCSLTKQYHHQAMQKDFFFIPLPNPSDLFFEIASSRIFSFTCSCCCKVLFNLKYYNLISYNWNCCYNQNYTKVIYTKLSPKCCQHNARYMLYLWGSALCCSAHGCSAVECGVACWTAQHTAIATLKLPCTRLVAHQSTGQLQPNTLMNSQTLGGLVEHQGMPKE